MEPIVWKFADSFRAREPARVASLTAWRSYSEVVDAIVASSVLVAGTLRCDPRKNGDPAIGRVTFRIRTDAEAVDAFFNSAAGYRAQFARSVEQGEKANRAVIQAILKRHRAELAAEPDAELSLQGLQAKVWMVQDFRVTGALMRREPVPPIEIEYAPWVARRDESTEKPHEGRRYLAIAGTLAPRSRDAMIDVKGGWLDRGRQPWPDEDKRERSLQIYRFGFS